MTNEEWGTVRVILKSWGAPAYDAEIDLGYRMMLNDLEPVKLAKAIKFIGTKDPSNFRPSAHVIQDAYDTLQTEGAPRWAKAERMAARAVTRRTQEEGVRYLRSAEGGKYVEGWLKEYGWRKFALETQDSYTYNAQRKTYEEYIAGAREDAAARVVIGAPRGRGEGAGLPRRIDERRVLPRGAGDDSYTPPMTTTQEDNF